LERKRGRKRPKARDGGGKGRWRNVTARAGKGLGNQRHNEEVLEDGGPGGPDVGPFQGKHTESSLQLDVFGCGAENTSIT